MSCIFCQIADGKKPAKVFFEDAQIIVFADILPRAPVHLLVCPKKHYASLLDLPEELLLKLHETIRKIATELSIKDNFRLIVNNGAAAGQIVEHLHFHFISNARGVKLKLSE
ncbi:MAG: HIT domain-containing protein [Candidatus Zixiibacteriota bacterium]|nr:MAG: HIT domain-containing protein [candidate division Zixibacteria bacterium]